MEHTIVENDEISSVSKRIEEFLNNDETLPYVTESYFRETILKYMISDNPNDNRKATQNIVKLTGSPKGRIRIVDDNDYNKTIAILPPVFPDLKMNSSNYNYLIPGSDDEYFSFGQAMRLMLQVEASRSPGEKEAFKKALFAKIKEDIGYDDAYMEELKSFLRYFWSDFFPDVDLKKKDKRLKDNNIDDDDLLDL